MAYRINDSWSLRYKAESFFVNFDDEISGALLNNEVSVQFEFQNGIALGLGLTRVATDLDYDGDEGRGRITDSHTGYLLSAGYDFI